VLGEQSLQLVGDVVAMVEVGAEPGAEGVQGVGAACEEGAEQVADGLAAVAEVGGDPGSGPSGIGEYDHLKAVADPGRQRFPPQGLELFTGCVVEFGADHTEL